MGNPNSLSCSTCDFFFNSRCVWSPASTQIEPWPIVKSTDWCGHYNNTPVSGGVSGDGSFSTGDIKGTIKNTADAGWVMMDDGNIGNAGSGASNRANADCMALFLLLWGNVSDAYAPVSGGRGASAIADWTALKRIQVLTSLGRVIGNAGSGSGLTPRTLGQTLGEETHLLITSEIPAHTHQVTPLTMTDAASGGTTQVASTVGGGGGPVTSGSTGGGGAHNNMQPTIFVNWMMKL